MGTACTIFRYSYSYDVINNYVKHALSIFIGSESSHSTTSLRRNLRYNLNHNFISSTQKLVAFRLVIPTSSYTSSPFQVNVYQAINPINSDPEDSGDSQGKYMDLHVEVFDHPNKFPLEEDSIYELVLEIGAKSISNDRLVSILDNLQPMLVVYSYDSNILKHLFQVSDSNVLKRNVPEALSSSPPFEELKEEFCHINSVNVSSVGDMEVVNPPYLTISFCYGHCKLEGPDDENVNRTSQHSKFVGYQAPEFEEAGINPCCIPTGSEYTNLELKKNNVITMIIVHNHVTGCGCY